LADLSPELQINALQTLGCPVIPIIPDAQQLGTLKALIHAWACIYLLKIILKSALQGSENGLKRTGNSHQVSGQLPSRASCLLSKKQCIFKKAICDSFPRFLQIFPDAVKT
jgi:hypothetical protein